MPRGPKMSNSVKDLILNESLRDRNNPRRALAADLQHTIRRMGEPVPSEDTLVKMISKYRVMSEDDLDKPWSIAKSSEYDLPAESTAALLKAWRYCQAMGKPFSIRQAKWATYLSPIISNTIDLADWSEHYSNFEKGYKLRGLKFTSLDLDAALIMSYNENAAATLTGKVIPIPLTGGTTLVRPESVNDSIKYTIDEAYRAARIAEYEALSALRSKDIDPGQASREADFDWDVLPPFQELDLDEDLVWIYVHWLTALTRGPNWQGFERSQVIDIIKQLRKWASEQLPEMILNISHYILDSFLNKEEITLSDFPIRMDLIPTDIAEKVGFTGKTPFDSPGQWSDTYIRLANLAIGKERMENRNKKNKSKKRTEED